MKSDKHRKNAFTLIELLAVVTVIVILSGILIPVAGSVIRQSRIASSKARLWQYITAIENFKAEYSYYPRVYGDGGNGNSFTVSLFVDAFLSSAFFWLLVSLTNSSTTG